jgi:hypothetical protein
MLAPELIEQIRHAWVTAGSRYRNSGIERKVPMPDDLQNLTEVAFAASMKEEEGRRARVRLVFLNPDEEEHAGPYVWQGCQVLRFDKTVPLSANNVAKLAPALESRISALLVTRSAGAERHAIVGTISYDAFPSRFDPVSQGLVCGAMSVSVAGPGSLVFAQGDSVVARLSNGELVEASAGPFASDLFIDHVLRVIRHSESKPEEMDYWFLYRDALSLMWRVASAGGHGGTIAWIPAGMTESALRSVSTSRGVKHFESGRWWIDGVMKYNEGSSARALALRDARNYLERVARLANVDGALVVDSELRALAFGARLSAPEWKGTVIEGPVPGEPMGRPFDVARLGTRHNSAVNLAGEHPGVVAFVASEDGPVRTILADRDIVYVWPDCLQTVFLGEE